jgi:hypothetical protein
MPHKELKFNEDARRALERGVNVVADAGLAPPDSVERSGAGVEPTQPRVTRPHRS